MLHLYEFYKRWESTGKGEVDLTKTLPVDKPKCPKTISNMTRSFWIWFIIQNHMS